MSSTAKGSPPKTPSGSRVAKPVKSAAKRKAKAKTAPAAEGQSAPPVTETRATGTADTRSVPKSRDPGAADPPRGDDAAPGPARDHPMDRLAAATDLPEQLAANIERIEALTRRLVAAMAAKPIANPAIEMPGPDFFAATSDAWMRRWVEQPGRVLQSQAAFWGETLRHYAEASAELAKGQIAAPEAPASNDKRFSNPLWDSHPFFAFVRGQYEINARALSDAVSGLDIEDATMRRRIDWFTRQLIDMMAPTNFLATNPDALERAIATEGESLVRGLENLVADIESADGELIVNLVDKSAFAVGENIATTPGEVVARTALWELIQYSPTTDKVHKLPLILFPPWINKFYILDLKPQNSLIRWLVAQGFTLFVVSWKNPGPAMADIGMDDYVSAYLEAMDAVRDRTGEARMNAVGYCIGGTTLHLVLGLLAARGDDRVNAATLFTTLTDFSDQGEFTTFLQDDFIGGIEAEIAEKGVLGAQLMARTFSFLRANDLIWGPAVRHYMMGETPPAFDLLYWNADATNLPGRMAREYLRGLCQANALAGEGFDVLGTRVHLRDITLPICAVACERDHIAPWLDCWRGFAMTGASDRTFILSESGHVAGIVNPAGRMKYGHYTSDAGFGGSAEDWRAAAEFRKGSWWPSWQEWLAPRSGPMVPARQPQDSLGRAPGSYVHEAANAV